jgi:hypothetical protein
VSGYEILTITFSFIVGLGVAQVLRSANGQKRAWNKSFNSDPNYP